MTEEVLPRFTVGIDQLSDETALPRGAVRDALNVDFDSDGLARRRPGAVPVESGSFHSLWRGTGIALCVKGDRLCRVTAAGTVELASLPSAGALSYAELGDRIVVSNTEWIGEILPDLTVRDLGVEDGPMGAITASATGGLPEGTYGVALSLLRGNEEGALSPFRFVNVASGGGIMLDAIPVPTDHLVTTVRAYRTTPGGDTFYRTADFPAGLTSYVLGAGELGRIADTAHLRRMPPGAIVRAWRGRLLVARGRTLRFSEPMRYGLHSPRTGFVQEASAITMVAPVLGGIFVGTRTGVTFYRGTTPGDWTRVALGAEPPVPGTHQAIDTSLLNPKFETGSTNEAALWLGPQGFVVGLADGSLIQPQARRISLSAQRGHTAIYGRQALSVVQ